MCGWAFCPSNRSSVTFHTKSSMFYFRQLTFTSFLPWLTCLVDLRRSLCLSSLAGAAESAGPLLAASRLGHCLTLLIGALKTLATVWGCEGSGLVISDYYEWRRPLDWNLESEAHRGLREGQKVPCWGPHLSRKSSGPGLNVLINWELDCQSWLPFPLRCHHVG